MKTDKIAVLCFMVVRDALASLQSSEGGFHAGSALYHLNLINCKALYKEMKNGEAIKIFNMPEGGNNGL